MIARRIASRVSTLASSRSCGHSVTITAASAPVTVSSGESQNVTPWRMSLASATGSHARTSAPSASSRDASTIEGASRMSSVFGLNASPRSATVFPRSDPRCFLSLLITRRFCSSLTSITAFSSWKW